MPDVPLFPQVSHELRAERRRIRWFFAVRFAFMTGPQALDASNEASGAADRALRAMFWGLDRFQRSRSLHDFKAKFTPGWDDRYLAVPGASALPEVLIALVRAHLPPLPAATLWVRSTLASTFRPGSPRPSPA